MYPAKSVFFVFTLFGADGSCGFNEFADINALASLMRLVGNALAFAFFVLEIGRVVFAISVSLNDVEYYFLYWLKLFLFGKFGSTGRVIS